MTCDAVLSIISEGSVERLETETIKFVVLNGSGELDAL